MKKFQLMFSLMLPIFAQAQEKIELNHQDGVFVSYQLIKTDETKKKDKYTIQVSFENRNKYDLFYPVLMQPGATGSLTIAGNSGSFTNIKIHNAVDVFLKGNSISGKGTQSKNITVDGKTLFLVPKSDIITASSNFNVKKGESPNISNFFAVSLKKLADFDLAPYGIPLPFAQARFVMAELYGSGDIMPVGQQLKTNECLSSANLQYYLVLQEDGNLCVLKRGGAGKDIVIWAAMTNGKGTNKLALQEDGNLVLNNIRNAPVWSSETIPSFDMKYKSRAYKPVKLVLENDGTLVLISETGNRVWTNKNTGSPATAGAVLPKPFPGARFPMAGLSNEGNILPVNQTLTTLDCLLSQNQLYYLTVQEDGNICIYRRKPNGVNEYVWCTQTNDKKTKQLTMQPDGNLVASTADKSPVWSTETMGYFNPKYNLTAYKPVSLRIENDGSLSLLNSSGSTVWKNK